MSIPGTGVHDVPMTGLERFCHLEDRFYRASDFFDRVLEYNRRLQEEIAVLQRESTEMRTRIQDLEAALGAARDEVKRTTEKVDNILEALGGPDIRG